MNQCFLHLIFLNCLSYIVLAYSPFFDVPIQPYLVVAANASKESVIIAVQIFGTIPNLIDISNGKQLTNFTTMHDSGIHMGAPLVTRDGSFVFAPLSYQGGNPSLLAIPRHQYLLVAALVDGSSTPVIITSDDEIALGCTFSSTMLFIKGNSLWLFNTTSNEASLQLVVDSTISDVVCSPTDDITIAFTLTPGTSYSFIATYRLGDSRYKPVSAGADYDDQPTFSPSGKKLAWRRRRFQYDCMNVISRVDYKVLLIDVDKRIPQEVYHGNWLKFDDYGLMPIRFLDESSILFPFVSNDTKKGWVHIALWSKTRGVIDVLYGMHCDAFNYDVVFGRGLLITHNCDLLESRSLSFYEASSFSLNMLLIGSTVFEYGVADRDGLTFAYMENENMVACLRSSVIQSDVLLVDFISFNVTSTIPGPVIPMASEFVTPQLVYFHPSDNPQGNVAGFLFLPKGQPPTNGFRAVIWTHGGPHGITTVGLGADTYYAFMVGFHSYLATTHQIATLALNYRCSIGYGCAFEGLPYACPDNAERFDIIGAAEFLGKHHLIDSRDGIGIHGLSYGAWNAYTAISFRPDLFAVGVGVSGVSNRAAQQPFVAARDAHAGGRNMLHRPILPSGDRLRYGPFPDINFPGWSKRADDNVNYLFEKSPISRLSDWTTPTLIMGCGDDDVVPVSQSIALYHQLQAIGTEAEFHLFPEAVHAGDTEEIFQRIGQLTADFLVGHLNVSGERREKSSSYLHQGVYPLCTATEAAAQPPSSCLPTVVIWVSVSASVGALLLSMCVLVWLLRIRKKSALVFSQTNPGSYDELSNGIE